MVDSHFVSTYIFSLAIILRMLFLSMKTQFQRLEFSQQALQQKDNGKTTVVLGRHLDNLVTAPNHDMTTGDYPGS